MIEITEDDALGRMMAYCASAEHCRAEVVEKMQRWGLPYEAIDRVVDRLEQGIIPSGTSAKSPAFWNVPKLS